MIKLKRIVFFLKILACFVTHRNPKILPKNPPDCAILCNRAFDNFILGDEPFTKAPKP